MEVKNNILLDNSNVTGQKASELTMELSESRYRKIIESISEAVYEIDSKGVVIYISPSIEKLTGYTPEEITGTTILNFIDDRGYSLKERIQELKSRKDINGEFMLLTKAGEECWIRFSTNAKFTDEVFTGGYGILYDVSEKKKTEVALQQNEEKYRLLAENISDVIWVYHLPAKEFTYMSPSVYNLRGVALTEAKNRKLEDDLAEDSVKTMQQRIASTLPKFLADPTQKACYLDEVQIRKNDGSMIWIETNSHFNMTKSGEIEIIGVSRNIESRKQSEMYLQKYAEEIGISEEKFYSIFNNSPVSMVITDPQSLLIMDVNEEMVTKLGLNKKDIIGKKLSELGFDLRGRQYDDIVKTLTSGKSIRNYESSIMTWTGEKLDFLVSVDFTRLKGYEYFLLTAIDITQIKKNETRIRHLNSQQKLIADISQFINLPADFRDVLTEVLKKIGYHTGVSRVYIFEDSPDGTTTSNTYEWCNDGIDTQKKTMKEIPYNLIPSWKKIMRKEGRIFSENVKELPMDILLILEPHDIKSIMVYPLYVENKSVGFIGFDECGKHVTWRSDEIELLRTVSNIISNAFARKQMVDRLENSELRLKLAIESAKEGLWDWNIESGEVFFSDVWCKLMECQPDKSVDSVSNWENRVHPDDKVRVTKALNAHLKGETSFYEAVYRVNSRNGKLKWLLEHGMVVGRNSLRQPLRAIGMIIDITGQKEIEKLLKESVESQQKLFSIIAHDLRGPLGNFVQILELITNGGDLDEENKNMFLNELRTASGSTFALLENLLNWSRCQTNTIKIELAQQNILKMLNENVELMGIALRKKNIELVVKVDEKLTALCDVQSINLVIRNLLSNAIKFTNRNGKIGISAITRGKFIEIEVCDNGTGMDKNTLDRLFEQGSFHSRFGTEREKGSGLGLLLCKDFVERNGGEIRVVSEQGEEAGSSLHW
ncbi:MAG: PAS domain S-box protein [Bacteroidales bacterium]|nr:PAS domain S-box protein [Bacteroidales bacterium]